MTGRKCLLFQGEFCYGSVFGAQQRLMMVGVVLVVGSEFSFLVA